MIVTVPQNEEISKDGKMGGKRSQFCHLSGKSKYREHKHLRMRVKRSCLEKH